MHIVKNYMADQLEGVNPPLILGIWGPKGCGKTFQTELALKKLGYGCSALSLYSVFGLAFPSQPEGTRVISYVG